MAPNASKFLSFSQWSHKIAQEEKGCYEKTLEKSLRIEQRFCYYADGRATQETRNKGDELLEKLMNNMKRFDELGMERSINQTRFHKEFTIACLKKIYGSHDLHRSLPWLIREFGLTELNSNVIVHMPRRHGKTMGTAMFASAYLVSIPNCEISIYSTGRRASKKLLVLVKKFVKLLGGDTIMLPESNMETLRVQTAEGSVSSCHSYPQTQGWSTSDGGRKHRS